MGIAALSAAPAVAAAAEGAVVPPSNSAAAQYTETFPTSGGDKKTDQAHRHHSPAKVLGKHNVQKLEKQGPEGRAAAEVAAATAPSSIETPPQQAHAPSTPNDGGGRDSGNNQGDQSQGDGGADVPQQAGGENGDGAVHAQAEDPSGSSGVGAAVSQATGLSTGGSGPLLPLVIIATLLWAFAYLWRQRRRVE